MAKDPVIAPVEDEIESDDEEVDDAEDKTDKVIEDELDETESDDDDELDEELDEELDKDDAEEVDEGTMEGETEGTESDEEAEGEEDESEAFLDFLVEEKVPVPPGGSYSDVAPTDDDKILWASTSLGEYYLALDEPVRDWIPTVPLENTPDAVDDVPMSVQVRRKQASANNN